MTGFDDARFWLEVLRWLITLAIGLYVWVSNRSRATKSAIERVDHRHTEAGQSLRERVSHIEGAMDHLPKAEQVAELQAAVTRAEGSIKAVDAKVDGLASLSRATQATLEQLVENELAEGRASKGRRTP